MAPDTSTYDLPARTLHGPLRSSFSGVHLLFCLIGFCLNLALVSVAQADENAAAPSAGFWAYYLEYSTDDGDVFDPSDLEDVTTLMRQEAQKNPETTNQPESDTEDD